MDAVMMMMMMMKADEAFSRRIFPVTNARTYPHVNRAGRNLGFYKK